MATWENVKSMRMEHAREIEPRLIPRSRQVWNLRLNELKQALVI